MGQDVPGRKAGDMGMRKICFFSGDITRSGGTERVSVMIANGLAGQGKYGVLFLSLTEQGGKPFFALEEGMEHYALGEKWIRPGPGYLKVIPKLRNFLRRHEIDVIVDIDIVLDVLSIPAAGGLRTRVVSWEHFYHEYEMQSLYRRAILKYSVKRSDYIVTLTNGSREWYRERAGRKDRIVTIYNPVQETGALGGGEKEKWLITAGHLTLVKGMDYLGETAVLVLGRHPDWKWIVVGEGEERARLEAVIEENALQGRLILTGRREDVNSYLEKAQIYVMTSRTEGLPMSLLEAKAFRLPSVSFNIPGPDEIIEDGVSGCLVKAFDCMEMAEKLGELMEDGALRERYAENAWNNLDKFRLEGILERWNEVLEACTGVL